MGFTSEQIDLINQVADIQKEIPDLEIINEICKKAISQKMIKLEKLGKKKLFSRTNLKKYFDGVVECLSLEKKNKLFVNYKASRNGISTAFFYLTEVKTPKGMLYFFITKLAKKEGDLATRTLIVTGHLVDRFVERVYNKFSTRSEALEEIGKVFLNNNVNESVTPIVWDVHNPEYNTNIMWDIKKGQCLGDILTPLPNEITLLNTFISTDMLTPKQIASYRHAKFVTTLLKIIDKYLEVSISSEELVQIVSASNFTLEMKALCAKHRPEDSEFVYKKIAEALNDSFAKDNLTVEQRS